MPSFVVAAVPRPIVSLKYLALGAALAEEVPSRAGLMSAMPSMEVKRNEETEKPDFLITGSSGNTREGQLVTFSGGARG